MQNLYMISGLGADKQLFSRLNLAQFRIIHLPWLINDPGESLETYARRMRAGIKDDNPLILGFSFGGIVAQEISRQIPVKKLILISTLSSTEQAPWYFTLIKVLFVHKWIPSLFLQRANPVTYRFFGLKTKEDRIILQSIFRNSNSSHFRWAIDQILHWNRDKPECPYTHIHGSLDRIFPPQAIHDAILIEGGHHFIIYQQPEKVESEILKAL